MSLEKRKDIIKKVCQNLVNNINDKIGIIKFWIHLFGKAM